MKVDLEVIYEVARKDIMGIAGQYSELSNQVDPVATDDLDPVRHVAEGRVAVGGARGSPSVLRSGGSVKAMREIAQAMFALSSSNSEETALAL